MWPNYRVCAVNTDGDTDTTEDVVMVQAINYYHPDSGDSGHITLKTTSSDGN